MIDFLNLSENKSNCECSFAGDSMQLLPLKYDPYVLYIGEYADFEFLASIDILNIYGEEINLFNTIGSFEHEGYISLKNIQYDDHNNVVLKITLKDGSGNLKTLYSDPLKVSSYKPCKTTRVNFKCLETDIEQSISFPFWFSQEKRAVDLEKVYQISVKTQVTYPTANAKYKVYKTAFMSIDTINKLSDALIMPFVYFNYKRVNLFDAIEIPEIQADEKFGETVINVSEYKGIGNNDITPVFNIITEDNNNMIAENNDNLITESNN